MADCLPGLVKEKGDSPRTDFYNCGPSDRDQLSFVIPFFGSCLYFCTTDDCTAVRVCVCFQIEKCSILFLE